MNQAGNLTYDVFVNDPPPQGGRQEDTPEARTESHLTAWYFDEGLSNG